MNIISMMDRAVARLIALYNFQSFRWRANLSLRRLAVGEHNSLSVPIRCMGCGYLEIGSNNSFGYKLGPRLADGHLLIQPRNEEARIKIGSGNCFSNNIAIIANSAITIGDRCQIADQVCIYDCDFHEISPATRNRSWGACHAVSIGDNVWIGSRSIILKGVSIGNNSIVGAMSVVTKPIPDSCIATGNPAKIIRTIE